MAIKEWKEVPVVEEVKVVPYLDNVINVIHQEVYRNIDKFEVLKKTLIELHKDLKLIDPCPIAWLELSKDDAQVIILVNTPCSYTLKGMIPTDKIENKKGLKDFFSNLVNKGIPPAVWGDQVKRTALATKKQTIGLEAFLRSYTNIQSELKLRDDEVRDMALKIKSHGSTYELILCENPSDYLDMFSCQTGSCMQLGGMGGAYTNAMWHEAKDKFNLHPGSWYHWTGSSKGIFLRKISDRVVVARGMVYKDKNGAWTEYGDVHHVYHGAAGCHNPHVLMMEHMASAGFRVARPGLWAPKEVFRVPSYVIGGSLRCPYPYGDKVDWNSFGAFYDQDTHEFVFIPGKGPAPYRYDQKGYMDTSKAKPLPEEYKLKPIVVPMAA